jgi:hypothetical protein
MLANINIDINALIKELDKQSKSAKSWKTWAYAAFLVLGYKLAENRKLKEQVKSLTKDIEVLKTTKGE